MYAMGSMPRSSSCQLSSRTNCPGRRATRMPWFQRVFRTYDAENPECQATLHTTFRGTASCTSGARRGLFRYWYCASQFFKEATHGAAIPDPGHVPVRDSSLGRDDELSAFRLRRGLLPCRDVGTSRCCRNRRSVHDRRQGDGESGHHGAPRFLAGRKVTMEGAANGDGLCRWRRCRNSRRCLRRCQSPGSYRCLCGGCWRRPAGRGIRAAVERKRRRQRDHCRNGCRIRRHGCGAT